MAQNFLVPAFVVIFTYHQTNNNMNVGTTMWVDWDGPNEIVITGHSNNRFNIARTKDGQRSNLETDHYHGLTAGELNQMKCNKPRKFN